MRPLVVPGCVLGLFAAVGADPPAPPGPRPAPGLRDPVPLLLDGRPAAGTGAFHPIPDGWDDTVLPHAADLDGSGRPDLLLGTRHRGRMLVARNTGTPGRPAFGPPRWFDERHP